MNTTKEFRWSSLAVLAVIVIGAGIAEIFGLAFFYDALTKPALIPLLVLPPLAALALAVYFFVGRRKS